MTSATPAVVPGASTTLSWSSGQATSCAAGGGWSGALALSGSQATPAIGVATQFTVTCSDAAGHSTEAALTVELLPTVTLSAAPPSVAPGGSSTLSWTSANASACTAGGGWSGTRAASGSAPSGVLATTTQYTLTCSGAGGNSAPAQVTVTMVVPPMPVAVLSVAPGSIASGGAAMLAWSSMNATGCTASGAWSGNLASSGSQSTGALSASATYQLTCTGAGGSSATQSATVAVQAAAPTVSLSASPTAIASGATSVLSWTSTATTGCAASGGWQGALPASGSQTTIALNADTSFTVTCAGGGGTSASASVSVAASAFLKPRAAAVTSAQPQSFAATLPGDGSATWSVDGIDGGSATGGLITPHGLYTPGTAPGVHAIRAVSTQNTAIAQSASVAVTDLSAVATYHQDLARDGANTQEYALTPATVSADSFGKLAACPVDGAVYAQPLWVAQLQLQGVAHNVVFVATEHDSVYAFDADAALCTLLWHANLLDAAHGAAAGETSVPSNLVGAGQGSMTPEVGVTGTPVIDAQTGVLYVVSKSIDATQTSYFARLHALALSSGSEMAGAPALISATVSGTAAGGTTVAFDAHQELQRSALAFVNGSVYIAFASHEDAPPYYGWVFAYTYQGTVLTQTARLNTAPDKQLSGIWMSGAGPAADSNGNLYVATGNGYFDASSPTPPNTDYGDSLLELTPQLAVAQYWTPSDQNDDWLHDGDFGSGGTAVLADLPAGSTYLHALVAGGKDGQLVVLNRDALGSYSGPTIQTIGFNRAIFETPAFWNNTLYLVGSNNQLSAYSLDTSTVQFSLAATSPNQYLWPAATPTVSADGTSDGIVWLLETNQHCLTASAGCGPAVLHAHTADNVASELYSSAAQAADAAGNAVKFTLPTVANGRVYFGTRGDNQGGADASTATPGTLEIYGLKP